MRITVIGGGPGGLYFALLTKKRRPDWDIEIVEQNQADDTFGFGVVFSDETLHEFLSRDRASFDRIRTEFRYWDDVAVHKQGVEIRCAGNGFAGIARMTLLRILQERCREEGVTLRFGVSIAPDALPDADIIVAADGVNSRIREQFRDAFQPSTVLKSNRFCWMGSTRPMGEFNYFFRETEHGIVCAHTYQYEAGRSTWIFEMDDACWRGHGFDAMDEAQSKAALELLYADELAGHPLLLNRSQWRQFPRIYCNEWSHENIVLLGDAKASAHYSIGSGTKLAMECAISLSDAVVANADPASAFAAYEKDRRAPCQIIQHNADVSLAWFEHMNRSWDMSPEQFAMVVMCRAKSITYDNLLVRDPDFVARVDAAFYERLYRETGDDYRQTRPTPMFTRFKLRDMTVENRVAMSAMAQYSADADGNPTDWHFVHYTSHAVGGAGLVFTEMTCPSADARITPGCTGLWTDEHEARWKRIADFVHANTKAKLVLQLGHAGRKGSTQLGWQKMDQPLPAENWPIYSASAIAYHDGVSQVPKALDRADMDRIVADFRQATQRADRAGFDMIELHCAHGYLLASFLSPLTNRRDDEYGGSIENRLRFPLEVFNAVREVWPSHKPMSVRVSATDWVEGGISEADIFAVTEAFAEAGCDLMDASAGQTVADQKPVYGRMFQVQFAEAIRNVPKMAVMTVGAITEPGQVNTILHTRRADLVALGRPHLWNPYFAREAAAWYDTRNQHWPKQYLAGRDQAHRELPKKREQEAVLRRKARPRLDVTSSTSEQGTANGMTTKRGWALATVETGDGATACIEVNEQLYRLAPSLARVGHAGADTVMALFQDWPTSAKALDEAADQLSDADRVTATTRLAPLLYPGKILCAGANYYDHLAEMGMPGAKKEDQRLFFFMKPPRNAVVGMGATVHMPIGTAAFDWEIELACVIGTRARNVPVETALDHVAGYSVAIDFSARDHNRAPETFYKLDWVAGKANDTCCPMGPRFVPVAAQADWQDVSLQLSVNDALKQDGRTSQMIFSIAEQISIASRIMTLDPGDVVLTGTPAGVGVPKGTFLSVGDRVDATIAGIGTLSVSILPPSA